TPAKLQHRLGKGLRRFLRRVVADARQHAALIWAAKMPAMRFRAAVRCDAVIGAVKDDGGNADLRLRRQSRLDRRIAGIAGDAAKTMPIGMDHDIDKVLVVERRSRPL